MKKYKIVKTYRGREREVTGTVEELTKYFSYTLEVGYSYNQKINLKPKTIKSFISNLEKAFEIKEGACYERTSITLIGEVK